MHREELLISLLLLASAGARRVFTSVIQPPVGFKGSLETFMENMRCDYNCEENEDDDLTEILWLWREDDGCGVTCTFVGVLQPDNPDSATDSVKPASSELPENMTSDRPANGSTESPANEPTDGPANGSTDSPANRVSSRPAKDTPDYLSGGPLIQSKRRRRALGNGMIASRFP